MTNSAIESLEKKDQSEPHKIISSISNVVSYLNGTDVSNLPKELSLPVLHNTVFNNSKQAKKWLEALGFEDIGNISLYTNKDKGKIKMIEAVEGGNLKFTGENPHGCEFVSQLTDIQNIGKLELGTYGYKYTISAQKNSDGNLQPLLLKNGSELFEKTDKNAENPLKEITWFYNN